MRVKPGQTSALRKGRKRRKRTWEDELAARPRRQQSAVWRYLMFEWGSAWSKWILAPATMDELRRRLAADAEAFVAEHGLDPHWAKETSGPVRRAAVYLWDIILHHGHFNLRRPPGWRRNRSKYAMKDMTEAQAQLIAWQAAQDAYSKAARSMLRGQRLQRIALAKTMHKGGMSPEAIAKAMGRSRSAVYEYLR